MSGDVQPRKRKDKRRKRDDRKSDGDVTVLRQSSFQDDDESSHGVHITKMGNEDVHLHVQHEHGTGGHWCAKIIFFALMAVLLGLVGLIIMENRGLEDLDTPLSESRFSKVFDGWVDEHRVEHEGHDPHEPSGEALDDHDDHDDHDEYDDHDEHEEEEEPLSKELEEEEDDHAEDEDEETAASQAVEDEDEEEEDEDENNAGENITAEDAEDEDDEDEDVEERTVEATVEATTEATAEYEADEDEDEEEDEEAGGDDNVVDSTEAPQSAADEEEEDEEAPFSAADEEEEDDDEQEVEESVEPPRTQSAAQSAPLDDNEDEDDQDNKDDDDDDEDDFESLDQQFENEDPEEKQPVKKLDSQEDKEQDQDDKEEPKEEGSSWLASLAVKFGVGVALALVSRLVLIRKSPNTNEEPAPEAVMRRRLTIATAEDHIPDDVEELPPLDDEYSEEEIEIEEEIEVEISDIDEEEDAVHDSDDNVASMASYVPETFEQLSALYKYAQEPAKESKQEEKEKVKEKEKEINKEKEKKEKEREPEPEPQAGPSDIYVEYEDGAIEDYEHDGGDSDEEITDEEDEISDVDDTDLMSRLEAKYGRLPSKEYESDPDSDDPSWTQIKPKETPAAAPAAEKEDPFEQELRKAHEEMIRENYAQALRSFNTLTQHYAHEPLAHLGRARLLELLAKEERSNQRVLEAIEAYKRYLAFGELVTSDQEFKAAGNSCIEHLRFMGYLQQAVNIHELLIERLPGDPQMRNQLSLTHLMANNLLQVEKVAAESLKLWPSNAVAQLHFGLALMHLHSDYARAQPYLQYAVESQAEGTQEAYFYISLGESLQRLSRQAEAVEVYRKGVAKGFFASLYQRSLYNEPRLRAQAFWQHRETGYERQLEQLQLNWRSIRDEALALLGRSGSYFQDEAEKLRDKGVWQQYELYAQGRQVRDNCRRAPITCNLLQQFPAAAGCRRGQVKFSVMQAQTHVWPHCGPTNCRLRAHLTLVAPEPEKTSLRVAEQERTWREGELFIFDDSFEHEVWHNGSQARLVLILDMWHPDLTSAQRGSLSPI